MMENRGNGVVEQRDMEDETLRGVEIVVTLLSIVRRLPSEST